MAPLRKPFQGIWNIVRFNWHFYVLALSVLIVLYLSRNYLGEIYHPYIKTIFVLIFGSTFISLLVSAYVYDVSNLYKLTWLDELNLEADCKIVNINAGFDETSVLFKEKLPRSDLTVLDFYDPLKHTEVSITRARKAYPPFPNTKTTTTNQLPLPDNYAHSVFLILAAHEIRNDNERHAFFKELNRILDQKGQIVITEHLRDLPNFLAYNIGFFHFMPKSTWKNAFEKSNFVIRKEIKITPFISTFILEKHGNPS